MKVNIISDLIKFQEQIRLLHWQTKKYNEHTAYGKTYNNLNDLIDNFVEVYIAKYGDIKFSPNLVITLYNSNSLKVDAFLKNMIAKLVKIDADTTLDVDLLAIRDEIVILINTLRYLLTLK